MHDIDCPQDDGVLLQPLPSPLRRHPVQVIGD